MGFVNKNICLENWLNSIDISFQLLSDSEYKKTLLLWRENFEDTIQKNGHIYQGNKAMSAVEISLTPNSFIFNIPGFKLLPASTNRMDKTYGYSIKNLDRIDRVLLNSLDAIICDESYNYTCIYTHEWQALSLPRFYNRLL